MAAARRPLSLRRLERCLAGFSRLRLLVVGDAMLDEYLWGDVDRVSPEAPVPVVHVRRESVALGGAANVVRNAVAMGAECALCAVAGRDPSGDRLIDLLKDLGVHDEFELVVAGDSLPVKKPDPGPLLHAAKELRVTPAESLMVGDSQSDVKAARAAGFQIVCMSYGYNHGEDIHKYNPDAVIDSMSELRGLLEKAA